MRPQSAVLKPSQSFSEDVFHAISKTPITPRKDALDINRPDIYVEPTCTSDPEQRYKMNSSPSNLEHEVDKMYTAEEMQYVKLKKIPQRLKPSAPPPTADSTPEKRGEDTVDFYLPVLANSASRKISTPVMCTQPPKILEERSRKVYLLLHV